MFRLSNEVSFTPYFHLEGGQKGQSKELVTRVFARGLGDSRLQFRFFHSFWTCICQNLSKQALFVKLRYNSPKKAAIWQFQVQRTKK